MSIIPFKRIKVTVAAIKYLRTTLNGGVYGVAIFPGKGLLIYQTLTLLGDPDLIIPLGYLFS